MTKEEEQELIETLDRLNPAENAFVLACITGEGFDEALARLEKEKSNEDN